MAKLEWCECDTFPNDGREGCVCRSHIHLPNATELAVSIKWVFAAKTWAFLTVDTDMGRCGHSVKVRADTVFKLVKKEIMEIIEENIDKIDGSTKAINSICDDIKKRIGDG